MLITPCRRARTWPRPAGQTRAPVAVPVPPPRLWQAVTHCPMPSLEPYRSEMRREESRCATPGMTTELAARPPQKKAIIWGMKPEACPKARTRPWVSLCSFVGAPWAALSPARAGGHWGDPQVPRSSPSPGQGCPVPGWVPLAPGAGCWRWGLVLSPPHLHLPSLYLPPSLCIAAITDTLKHNDLAVSVMDDRTFLSGLNHCRE